MRDDLFQGARKRKVAEPPFLRPTHLAHTLPFSAHPITTPESTKFEVVLPVDLRSIRSAGGPAADLIIYPANQKMIHKMQFFEIGLDFLEANSKNGFWFKS